MNATLDSRRPAVSFLELIDLASAKVGGKTLASSDDFFAPMENMLKPEPAIFIPGKYVDTGKWMDGWESRRKRNLRPGHDHDWCIVELGLPGIVRGLNVDTAFFTGNYPEYCAVDACHSEGKPGPKTAWTEILTKSRLQGDSINLFPIGNDRVWTHLRLRTFPDGGIARFRVHGEVVPDTKKLRASKKTIDLVAAENGGVVVTANDMHYGSKDNLIFPGRAKTMGEGWETRRKRGPVTPDWIVIKTAIAGKISKIEVDTNYFKGNYPESCSIEGCRYPSRDLVAADFRDRTDLKWVEILPRTKLRAHTQHHFGKELNAAATALAFDYIRLNIYPDGGISRLRIFGTPSA
ncbi:MAG: allantoicase [Bdellovibrionales bacterium]|nr:allantoicase [Bdellovibrionales bacterium]